MCNARSRIMHVCRGPRAFNAIAQTIGGGASAHAEGIMLRIPVMTLTCNAHAILQNLVRRCRVTLTMWADRGITSPHLLIMLWPALRNFWTDIETCAYDACLLWGHTWKWICSLCPDICFYKTCLSIHTWASFSQRIRYAISEGAYWSQAHCLTGRHSDAAGNNLMVYLASCGQSAPGKSEG